MATAAPMIKPTRPSIWKLDGPSIRQLLAASSPSAASALPSQSRDLVVSAPADWRTARECGRSLFGPELPAKCEAKRLLTLGRSMGTLGGNRGGIKQGCGRKSPEIGDKRSRPPISATWPNDQASPLPSLASAAATLR